MRGFRGYNFAYASLLPVSFPPTFSSCSNFWPFSFSLSGSAAICWTFRTLDVYLLHVYYIFCNFSNPDLLVSLLAFILWTCLASGIFSHFIHRFIGPWIQILTPPLFPGVTCFSGTFKLCSTKNIFSCINNFN